MALKRRDHDFTTGSRLPATQSCHDIFVLAVETVTQRGRQLEMCPSPAMRGRGHRRREAVVGRAVQRLKVSSIVRQPALSRRRACAKGLAPYCPSAEVSLERRLVKTGRTTL